MKNKKIPVLFIIAILFTIINIGYANQRILYVGVFNHPPVIFSDDAGTPKGIFIDLLQQIAEENNWRIKYVHGTWAEGIGRLQHGEIDIICSIMKSEERMKTMEYSSENIITIWGQLYTQRNSSIENILDVNRKKIGLMKKDRNGENFKTLCQKFNIRPQFIYFDHFDLIFQAIDDGDIDAGVATSTFGMISQSNYNIKRSPIMFSPSELFFASRKNQNELVLRTIDKSIRAWKESPDSVYYQILSHWMSNNRFTIEKIPTWIIVLLVTSLLLTILLILTSMTTKIRSQKEKIKMQSHLAHSQKMESIGNLAGGIAHDFNNLLTIIRGNAEMLQFNTNLEDADTENITQITHACDNASFLTSQLLTFSRKSMTEEKICDVNHLLQDNLKMFHRLIGEQINLNLNLYCEPLPINIDRNQFAQVIMNVILNARDAITGEGNIVISTHPYITNKVGISPAYVCISIKDDGVGMSKEVKSKIFDPFFTTKSIGKGTGLGMSVVYGIIENLNGFIELESEEMKGTDVRLYIPSSDEKCSDSLTRKEIIDPGTFRACDKLVLLIEDDPHVLDFTKNLLTRYNLKVITAVNTTDAEEKYQQYSSDIDLILSDVILTDGNGIELINRIIPETKNIQVLFYSGYSNEKSQKNTILEKGYHFIQKPFQSRDIISKIQEILIS